MENVLYKVEGMDIPSLSTVCIKVDTLDLWDDQVYELESITDTQSSLDTQFEFPDDDTIDIHLEDTHSDILIAELILDCDDLDIPSLDTQDTMVEQEMDELEEIEEEVKEIEDEPQVETYHAITFEQLPSIPKTPSTPPKDKPKPNKPTQDTSQPKTNPYAKTSHTLTPHVQEDVQRNNNDLVTTITDESKPNYSGMSIEELQQHVKVFMHQHGVKEAPVPASLVEKEFGARNILKLTRNLYLLQRKDGYTMSR